LNDMVFALFSQPQNVEIMSDQWNMQPLMPKQVAW